MTRCSTLDDSVPKKASPALTLAASRIWDSLVNCSPSTVTIDTLLIAELKKRMDNRIRNRSTNTRISLRLDRLLGGGSFNSGISSAKLVPPSCINGSAP